MDDSKLPHRGPNLNKANYSNQQGSSKSDGLFIVYDFRLFIVIVSQSLNIVRDIVGHVIKGRR